MRSVLSISIPSKKLSILKKKAKAQGMSVSAYVVEKIEEDLEPHLITEKELLQYVKEGQEDLKHGRVKVLRNPKDLLLDRLP